MYWQLKCRLKPNQWVSILAHKLFYLLVIKTRNLEVFNFNEFKLIRKLLSIVNLWFFQNFYPKCLIERRNKYEFALNFFKTFLLMDHWHLVIKTAKKAELFIFFDIHLCSQPISETPVFINKVILKQNIWGRKNPLRTKISVELVWNALCD